MPLPIKMSFVAPMEILLELSGTVVVTYQHPDRARSMQCPRLRCNACKTEEEQKHEWRTPKAGHHQVPSLIRSGAPPALLTEFCATKPWIDFPMAALLYRPLQYSI